MEVERIVVPTLRVGEPGMTAELPSEPPLPLRLFDDEADVAVVQRMLPQQAYARS